MSPCLPGRAEASTAVTQLSYSDMWPPGVRTTGMGEDSACTQSRTVLTSQPSRRAAADSGSSRSRAQFHPATGASLRSAATAVI